MKQYKNADGTRAKNVYVNSAITLIGQIVQILLGFIVRRLFIRYLGNSYLGYDSVFSNILQMLNIADLGISVAVTSFMYVPLAKKEQEAINALMYLYKRCLSDDRCVCAGIGSNRICFFACTDSRCSLQCSCVAFLFLHQSCRNGFYLLFII